MSSALQLADFTTDQLQRFYRRLFATTHTPHPGAWDLRTLRSSYPGVAFTGGAIYDAIMRKQRAAKVETFTLDLPAHWASGLVNGDWSGFDYSPGHDPRPSVIVGWLGSYLGPCAWWDCVDVGEPEFARSNDAPAYLDGHRVGCLGGDVATYTFCVGVEQ